METVALAAVSEIVWVRNRVGQKSGESKIVASLTPDYGPRLAMDCALHPGCGAGYTPSRSNSRIAISKL
jgi:hypothetical protein